MFPLPHHHKQRCEHTFWIHLGLYKRCKSPWGKDISEFRLSLSTIVSVLLSPLGFILHFWCIQTSTLFNQFPTMGKWKRDRETNDSINMGTYCCFSYLVWGAPNFIFKKEATLIGPSLLFFRNMGIPPNRSTKMLPCLQIPHFIIIMYIYKFNFGLSIWDKSVVLLGTYWGTHWELDGNAL